jgi:rSAM/selenodomain-associated transferase 1
MASAEPDIRSWPQPSDPAAPPLLAVIARAPETGRVKSRLAATIGSAAALAVYRGLLTHTAALASAWRGPVRVLFTGDEAALAGSPLGSFPRQPQARGGLGERLFAATAALLPGRPAGVLFIGTDCPLLTQAHLADLATALPSVRVAIGPARDGGYWGIAVRDLAAAACCFAPDLPWSQPGLLAATRHRLTVAGMSLATTTLLDDLDDVADLRLAEAAGFCWQAKHGPADDV